MKMKEHLRQGNIKKKKKRLRFKTARERTA